MDKDNSLDEYLTPSLADHAVELVKGVAGSLVPIPGGSSLAALIRTSHSRKLETFHRRVVDRVKELEEVDSRCLLKRAVDGDQDAQDEITSILSTVMRLVDEARNEEKREILAAAMVSTLTWTGDANDLERHYFLQRLSDFEAIHIQLLDRARNGVVPVRELVNEEGVRGEIAQSAWDELYRSKMVNSDSVGGMMTESGMKADRTTPRGMRFLKFVGARH